MLGNYTMCKVVNVINEKRKAFYKTEKGIAIKKMYKDRIAMKKKLLKQLSTMNVRKKCHKQLFDIEKLVKMVC